MSADDTRSAEYEAWKAAIGALGEAPSRPGLEAQMFNCAYDDLSSSRDALPGHGIYRKHVVRLLGWYLLLAACQLARLVGRQHAVDALGRLTAALDRDGHEKLLLTARQDAGVK